jgi:hypothetical protein
VQINTADPELETKYAFTNPTNGIKVYDVPLDPMGGMSSKIIKSTTLKSYNYKGNYLLVLKGSCTIDGTIFDRDTLVVAKTIATQSYNLSAAEGHTCLALGLSF